MIYKLVSRKIAAAAALVAFSVGSAHAVPYTWTDAVAGSAHVISGTYSYTHDITDGVNGYRAGIDSVSSATLSLWLYDDAFMGDIPLFGDGEEVVGFRFDNGSWISRVVDSVFHSLDQFDFTVTNSVSDGLLNVTLRALSGDFVFAGSTLTVRGDRATAVPEPAAVTMLGLGLLGMGLVARRRRRS